MKIWKRIGLLIIAIYLLSFSNDNHIIPDDYHVTKEMLEKFDSDKSLDSIFSFENAWFKNKELNEVLIFELYTDYHRLAIYHCKADFLLSYLINHIELHRKLGMCSTDSIDKELKFNMIEKFLESSLEIDKSYFKTKQGVVLGIEKAEAIKKYGNPSSKTINENIEILTWDFQGEYSIQETGENPNGKIAKDSWGYHVIMYFELDKLVSMTLKNDIP